MVQWFAEHSAVLRRLWFTDGGHFWLSGHVNSNALYWGYSVPVKVLTKPLYSDKVTAWIVMGREGVQIGMLFFFEHGRGVGQTINAERYLKLKLPEPTEMSSTNANVIHRSFCHSIWNTMISEFLTWYAYPAHGRGSEPPSHGRGGGHICAPPPANSKTTQRIDKRKKTHDRS